MSSSMTIGLLMTLLTVLAAYIYMSRKASGTKESSRKEGSVGGSSKHRRRRKNRHNQHSSQPQKTGFTNKTKKIKKKAQLQHELLR
jgi:hypothetical protein